MTSDLIGMTAFCITSIILMATTIIYANKYHRDIKKHNAEPTQQIIDDIVKSTLKKLKDNGELDFLDKSKIKMEKKRHFNYIGFCFLLSIIIGSIGMAWFFPDVPSNLHWIGIPILVISFVALFPIFRAIIRGE